MQVFMLLLSRYRVIMKYWDLPLSIPRLHIAGRESSKRIASVQSLQWLANFTTNISLRGICGKIIKVLERKKSLHSVSVSLQSHSAHQSISLAHNAGLADNEIYRVASPLTVITRTIGLSHSICETKGQMDGQTN